MASSHGPRGPREEPVVLSNRQVEAVDALREAGTLSVWEIADAILVSGSEATATVGELIRLGVVDRRIDPEDWRRRQVRLTAAWLPDRSGEIWFD